MLELRRRRHCCEVVLREREEHERYRMEKNVEMKIEEEVHPRSESRA